MSSIVSRVKQIGREWCSRESAWEEAEQLDEMSAVRAERRRFVQRDQR